MQEEYSYDIYWEKQGADYLCAVHCINSLLQGNQPLNLRPLFR